MRHPSLLCTSLLVTLTAFVIPNSLPAQTPTFAAPKQIPSNIPSTYSSVVYLAGNFNGNGNTDLIVYVSNPSTGAASLEFLSGNGAGTFTRTGTVTPISIVANSLVGDFNGDGKDDLISLTPGCEESPCENWPDEGNRDGIFTVWLGQGNGSFTQVHIDTLPEGDDVEGLVADLNKDGKPDIAVVALPGGAGFDYSSNPYLCIFLNNGNGTFTQTDYELPWQLSLGAPAPTNLVAGDFEGNGNLDLALAYESGVGTPTEYPELLTFAGDGKGHFGPATVAYTLNGYSFAGSNWKLFSSDLNGDGHSDLAITLQGPGPRFSPTTISLLTDSQGRFHWGSAIEIDASVPLTIFSDLNGDGHPDLFYIDGGMPGSTVENAGIYLGTATGAFKTPHISVAVPGTETQFDVTAIPLRKGALPSLFVSGAKSVALEFINTTP
jgi:hypothetical protein